MAQVAAAKQRRNKVDFAIVVASVSAWSLAVFAGVSWLFALFSLKAALVAAGLSACAFFEFRGVAGLKRMDLRAPARLAWNQFGLAVLIAAYCVWSALSAWYGPNPYAQAVATTPELGDMLEPFEDVMRQITVGVYALVLVLSVCIQASTIVYYRSRRKIIAAYLKETPGWIVELDRQNR